MIGNKYSYYLNLDIPSLEIKLDQVLTFLVIKEPIAKYTNVYITDVILTKQNADLLFQKLTEQDHLELLLSIYTAKDIYDCDVFDKKDIDNLKKDIIVQNMPFYIIKAQTLTHHEHSKDRITTQVVRLILTTPKSLLLQNSNELSGVYYNVSSYDLLKQYIALIDAEYSITTYERLTPTKFKYKQLIVKQDVDLLQFPFFLQYKYKISNGLPIMLYDSFSSVNYFYEYEIFKIFDLSDISKLLKVDLSKKFVNDSLMFLKKDKLSHNELKLKLTYNPRGVILVHEDGTTKFVNIDNETYTNKSKIKNSDKPIYVHKQTKNTNNILYTLHVIDNDQSTLERYTNLRNIYNSIHSINRVRIFDVDFRDYDIGVLYKFNSIEQYKYLFHNMCYYFHVMSSGSLLLTCDIIGDLIALV